MLRHIFISIAMISLFFVSAQAGLVQPGTTYEDIQKVEKRYAEEERLEKLKKVGIIPGSKGLVKCFDLFQDTGCGNLSSDENKTTGDELVVEKMFPENNESGSVIILMDHNDPKKFEKISKFLKKNETNSTKE